MLSEQMARECPLLPLERLVEYTKNTICLCIDQAPLPSFDPPPRFFKKTQLNVDTLPKVSSDTVDKGAYPISNDC